MAMLTPGLHTSRGEIIPRAAGDTFKNALAKLAVNKPELVLLRSWNNFTDGSEIAASRSYGYQNQDAINTALAEISSGHKISFRCLES